MQKQIPNSTHTFDYNDRTDFPPDYYFRNANRARHFEPILICLFPVWYSLTGSHSVYLPLWRMNGASPNDPQTPVILAHGMFSNRFGIDYNLDGEIYSLARFLANRGRDVWIMEWQQASRYSSASWSEYLYNIDAPWRTWYVQYMTTTNEATYNSLDAYFLSQDICSTQTAIVTADDRFTATIDDLVFEDTPAIIAYILYLTGQTQIQWVGHSIGATAMYGFLPTPYATEGKQYAASEIGGTTHDLPPNSVMSLTALAAPTALINVPPWLQTLRNTGQLTEAWIHRGRLPQYFNYLSQETPRWPAKMQGIMDTSQLKHLEIAIDNSYFAFFNESEKAQQYYHQLYEGATLSYAWPEWNQFTVIGHAVTVPVTAAYDGNGYDELGTFDNVTFLFDKLEGYSCLKPFYQFSHAHTAHSEMINGYVVENGVPGWPPHLQYDFGGTYHYIWYDLNRYLPPVQFTAYQNTPTTDSNPLISWQNNKDAVSYEIWAKKSGESFVKKVEGINKVKSAEDCTGLTPGTWKIKVRGFSLGGSWQDHSGLNSIGGEDDEAKYLTVIKT